MSTRLAVWLRDEFTCVYCGATAPAVRLTLDHVNERESRGAAVVRKPPTRRHKIAKNGADNLVTACWSCNSSRKRLSVTKFCERRGLCVSVVWRRIRARTARPLAGYREAVNQILSRGEPPWFEQIRRGVVVSGESSTAGDDADIPF